MRRLLAWAALVTALVISKVSAVDSYVAELFEWKKEMKQVLKGGEKVGQFTGTLTPWVIATSTSPGGDTATSPPIETSKTEVEHKAVTSVILPWEELRHSNTKSSSQKPVNDEDGANLKGGKNAIKDQPQQHESALPQGQANNKDVMVENRIHDDIGLPAHTQTSTSHKHSISSNTSESFSEKINSLLTSVVRDKEASTSQMNTSAKPYSHHDVNSTEPASISEGKKKSESNEDEQHDASEILHDGKRFKWHKIKHEKENFPSDAVLTPSMYREEKWSPPTASHDATANIPQESPIEHETTGLYEEQNTGSLSENKSKTLIDGARDEDVGWVTETSKSPGHSMPKPEFSSDNIGNNGNHEAQPNEDSMLGGSGRPFSTKTSTGSSNHPGEKTSKTPVFNAVLGPIIPWADGKPQLFSRSRHLQSKNLAPYRQLSEQSNEPTEQLGEQQVEKQSDESSEEQTDESSEGETEQRSEEETENRREQQMKNSSKQQSGEYSRGHDHQAIVAPPYPHNDEDHESHLPTVTEEFTPWDQVKKENASTYFSPVRLTKKKSKKPHQAKFVHCMKVIGEDGGYYECKDNSTKATVTQTPMTEIPATEIPIPTETEDPRSDPYGPAPYPETVTPTPTPPYDEPTPTPTKLPESTPAPPMPHEEPTPTPIKSPEPTPSPTKLIDEPTPPPTKSATPAPTKLKDPTFSPTKRGTTMEPNNVPVPPPATSTSDGEISTRYPTKSSTSTTKSPVATTDTNSTIETTTGVSTGETYTHRGVTNSTTPGSDNSEATGVSTGAGASSGNDSLGGGAIAGIIIACIVFVVVIVGAVFFKQRSIARQQEENLFTELSATGGRALETDYAAM